jgi:hypothetical protein
VSIPGKLPERIDPWLDSALSPGWIVRPFVQAITIVTLKVVERLLSGHGYDVHVVECDDPLVMHKVAVTKL